MLSNKVYLGHLEYGKRINLSYKSKKKKYIPKEEWKIVYNTHEPVISQELFDRVQNMRHIEKNIKKKKHKWELNGLVKGKECGAKMTLKVEYKRDGTGELKSKKICCLNGLKRYKGNKCIKGSKGLDEKVLNEIVFDNLKKSVKKIIKENELKNLICKKNHEKTHKSNDNQREIVLKELNKIEEEIKTLYSDFKSELLDYDDYKKFYEEKTNQRNRLKKELEVFDKEKESIPILTDKKLNDIIKEIFNMKGLSKDIILDIIDDIQIDNQNNIHINYKYNIFEGLA